MTTAYCFNLPYHGHMNPCISIARELICRGERVVVYGLDRFRSAAERIGAEFRVFDYEEFRKGFALMVMAEWQMHVIEDSMRRLLKDAEQDRPGYVLVDYCCLWGRVFAQHFALPAVVLHSTFPLPHAFVPAAVSTVRDLLRSPTMWRTYLAYRAADRRISHEYHVPRIGIPFNIVYPEYGRLHLVLTTRAMCPNARKFDGRYEFIGPCVRPRGITAGAELPQFDSRPLLYISMGTFWNVRPDFYRTCIAALRDQPVQVLISCGDRSIGVALGALPENVHVRMHVDQIAVLERADAFITHGGMNSVLEGLLASVPMLVFPQALDQFKQAEYITASGAGLAVREAHVSPSDLLTLVERLLYDTAFRERCREIAKELRASGGASRAADAIMALMPSKRDACPRPHRAQSRAASHLR